MSGRLDQSLDSIIESQKKAKKEAHRRRKVGVKAKAPVGGVKKTTKPAKPTVKAAAAASQSQSSKIVVSGLPLDVNEAQIKEYFIKTVGPVKKVTLQYNQNGQSRGIADVIFSKPGLAAKAAKDQNGMLIEVVVDARNVPEPAKQGKLADRVTNGAPAPAAAPAATGGEDLGMDEISVSSPAYLLVQPLLTADQYNESLRLSERRLVFNVGELKRIAAKCLHKPESEVKGFSKLAEGGFNRVFQLTMKDGSEVLARLPYPSTKPHQLAMASEAATLDLVRAAGVPAPKVLYYSTDAAQNPVGAEFMIMEKVPGRPIGDLWFDLTEDERLKIISELVQAEVKLSKIELPGVMSNRRGLCVGPHTSLRWWYKERGSIDLHRGPHSSPLELLLAVAAKELSWLKAFGHPRLPFERAYRECMDFKKSRPEEQIESLEKYMEIAPYLVPTDARFHRPILRHPDLQPNNIFVSENLDITGIIDWQHTSVLPQFLAAGIPKYFQNYHDEESLRFVPPKLPDDLEQMDDEEHAEALEQYRRRHLHFFYLGFTQRFNQPHFEVLDRRTDILTRKIFDHAGAPWEGNNIPLKADLIHLTQVWRQLIEDNEYITKAGGPPSCPISFAESEIKYTLDILQQQEETDTQLENVRNAIGINAEGWTPTEEYDGAVEREKMLKKQGLDSLDTEAERKLTLEHWPFDDFEEEE
ncbi:hypothetical protein DV735_g23, partial [Chaetothyriales sp. CBS 134920]